MVRNLTTIGFDADDTLWHNDRFFQITQERFAGLLADYADPDHLSQRLLDAERRNLGHYGFGIKGFMLSMIETALDVTSGRVPGSVIHEIIAAGQDMMRHPIELFPHARATIEALTPNFHIVLITKGDLIDQERKLAQSGLGDLFNAVEIVSSKTMDTYHDSFTRHGDGPSRAMMVGNSMKSDVLPAIEAGGWGVFIPHGREWEIEKADPPKGVARYAQLYDLSELPALVEAIG
jgi:putative hydrolase of the HAD superfamily